MAEQHLAQSAANGLHQSVAGRVVKTSDIILLKRPRIFNLAIGWESAQVCHHRLAMLLYIHSTRSRWPGCAAVETPSAAIASFVLNGLILIDCCIAEEVSTGGLLLLSGSDPPCSSLS